mmetsp:Transcript_84306/g.158697  ORF Transcript_84306/g.158697 Transcript_84306/m.158697 type:complete len:368 (+) Transcript_84306:137-1240(+)
MCFSNKCFGCPEKFRIYAIDAGASHDEWWIWHLNLDIWIGTSFMQLIQLGFQSIHRFLLWLMHWLHSPCLHLLWLHVLCRFLLWVPFVNVTCSALKVILLELLRSFCICGASVCTAPFRTASSNPAFHSLDSGAEFCSKPGLWRLLARRCFRILQGICILLAHGIVCIARGHGFRFLLLGRSFRSLPGTCVILGRGVRRGSWVLRALGVRFGFRMLGTILRSCMFCPVLILLFLLALLCSLLLTRCPLLCLAGRVCGCTWGLGFFISLARCLLFRCGFRILRGTGILLGRGILCTIRGLCTLGRGMRLGTCVLRVLSVLLGCRMLGTIIGSYIFCPVLVLLFFSRCWFSCLFALLCSLRFLRCRLTH